MNQNLSDAECESVALLYAASLLRGAKLISAFPQLTITSIDKIHERIHQLASDISNQAQHPAVAKQILATT